MVRNKLIYIKSMPPGEAYDVGGRPCIYGRHFQVLDQSRIAFGWTTSTVLVSAAPVPACIKCENPIFNERTTPWHRHPRNSA